MEMKEKELLKDGASLHQGDDEKDVLKRDAAGMCAVRAQNNERLDSKVRWKEEGGRRRDECRAAPARGMEGKRVHV